MYANRHKSTAGKAVIYVVRTRPDVSYLTAQLALDDDIIGVTHAGTYMRLEAAPGRHRISGTGQERQLDLHELTGSREGCRAPR